MCILKNAESYLSVDARNEIGFEWASCSWRHCGALADAQEALDQLDHLVGGQVGDSVASILEPFECLFVLDIVERSLYDILAVIPASLLQQQQGEEGGGADDPSAIVIPAYEPLQRMSDLGDDGIDQYDSEYLEALEFIKRTSTTTADDAS